MAFGPPLAALSESSWASHRFSEPQPSGAGSPRPPNAIAALWRCIRRPLPTHHCLLTSSCSANSQPASRDARPKKRSDWCPACGTPKTNGKLIAPARRPRPPPRATPTPCLGSEMAPTSPTSSEKWNTATAATAPKVPTTAPSWAVASAARCCITSTTTNRWLTTIWWCWTRALEWMATARMSHEPSRWEAPSPLEPKRSTTSCFRHWTRRSRWSNLA